MYQKGDIVEIAGNAIASYNGNLKRSIKTFNFSKPKKGIIIGYSFIRTGKLIPGRWNGYNEYVQGFLNEPIDNKVWVIEPLTHNNRYIKPYRCLESQIKKVEK